MSVNDKFEMVAKTFAGLEYVLAEELRGLGAENVEPGKRMVSFYGNLETLYRANLCCRTALRILKPFYSFKAKDPEELYEKTKDFDWSSLLSLDKTFAIDTTAYSEELTHSRYITYRVKDAIVDWFKDRYGADKRPGVRLQDADVLINVHVSGTDVTLSLDSSGESLHKRGYRVAQTEAPINEVLAAGIILLSGWRGETPFVDPMCGSGTFLVEAALIAANINPGIYRRSFAFENWKDFDSELYDRLYSDDSAEREITVPIIGADISPRAIAIAEQNLKSAGVARHVELKVMPISKWEEVPQPAGVVVTNPPYGERISAPDMDALYETIGTKLKRVFTGWHAWIIGYRDEYFRKISLAPSQRIPLYNGALECELREYVIFEGDRKSFVAAGGKIGRGESEPARKERSTEQKDFKDRRKGFKDSKEFKDRRRFNDSKGLKDFKDSKDFKDRKRTNRFNDFKDSKDFKKRDFRERRDDDSRQPRVESENPLAMRRNPFALKSIGQKRPTLPPTDGPRMRLRGWKRRDDGRNDNENKD